MAITAQFIADFNAFVKSTREAEQGLKNLEKGGKDLGESFDVMKGMATQLAASFGIAFSASALIGFAKESIATAAAIGDLAAATGLTTDSLQRLAFVGQGFGVDVDQLSRAVGNLSTRLASGDSSAVGAVQSLGLSVSRLLASGPTEAFLTIAEAAGRVEDPMQKGAIASDLFGDKLAKVLIPALGDLRTKMAEVPQDALISKAVIDSANEFEASIKHGVTRLEAWAAKILFAWSAGAKATADAKKVLDDTRKAQDDLSTAHERGITNVDLLGNRLTALRTQALEPLTTAQKETVGELLFYGEAQKDIARLVGVSESAIRLFVEAEKATAEASKLAAAEAQRFADIIDSLGRTAFANSKKEFDEWSARLTITTDRVAAAILRESEAQTVLNASHGLTALGTIKVTSAAETLRLGLEALHRTREGNISQAAQEQLLLDAYTASLYAEAIAQDRANAGLAQVPAIAAATATAMAGVTASYWAAIDAAAILAGIPDIGHRPPAITDPDWPRTHPFSPGGGLHPLRDSGGPVMKGQSYLIGMNRQPELFTPGANGFISPLGGSRVTVTNNFTIVDTAENLARKSADLVLKSIKQTVKLGSA